MRVCVLANEEQRAELSLKPCSEGTEIVFIEDVKQLNSGDSIDLYILLQENIDYAKCFEILEGKEVLVNSVIETLEDIHAPKNVHRINGWNSFLKRETWEIASFGSQKLLKTLESMQWKCIQVKDEPGLISARVVSMIINEAYFAKEDNISNKNDIDNAMKLGTNYPYGPFEWANIIGPDKIVGLLNRLFISDERYQVSSCLLNELKNY